MISKNINTLRNSLYIFLIGELILGLLFLYFYDLIASANSSGSLTDSIFIYFSRLYGFLILFISITDLLLYMIVKKSKKYIWGFLIALAGLILNIVIFIPFSSNDNVVVFGYIILPMIVLIIGLKTPLIYEIYKRQKK